MELPRRLRRHLAERVAVLYRLESAIYEIGTLSLLASCLESLSACCDSHFSAGLNLFGLISTNGRTWTLTAGPNRCRCPFQSCRIADESRREVTLTRSIETGSTHSHRPAAPNSVP
jgi:hypothetical protein